MGLPKLFSFIQTLAFVYNPLFLLLSIISLLSFLFFFMELDLKTQKKKKKNKKQLPPCPPKLPFLGNVHQLGRLPHRSLWNLSKKHGEVMLLKLGSVPTIVISSAKAAKEILKTHDLECCSRPPSTGARRLSYNFHDIGFAPYGDYWREIRKICALELFSVKRVKSFRSIREEEIASMINTISQTSCVSGIPVDLSKTFYSLTAGIMFRVAFGKTFQDLYLERETIKELVGETEALLAAFTASDLFPYVGWIFDRISGYHKRLEKCFHDLDNFLQRVIDDHLNCGIDSSSQEDIVDVLLKLEKNEYGFHSLQLTKDHIKAILMDIFIAGIDTSAITITWAMAELAKNPRVMKKAQAEIRNYLPCKGKVTEADVDHFQYLKNIVKETLRLHPPAPLLVPRVTMSSFKVGNYNIDPGTRIQVNVWGLGRDTESWKNPEEFFPERFMETEIDFKDQDFNYLPFGGGRRGCPGIYMGICTVELALASVLYQFDWKLPKGIKEKEIDMEEKFGLTVQKKSHLYLVPIKQAFP